MRQKIKNTLNNPLISGNAILFFGTLLGNLFNFLFNLFMPRFLSVSDYGILATLVSIILLCALIADSFIPSIVYFTGPYFAKKEVNSIRGLFWMISKYAFIFGLVVFFLFVLLSHTISDFFKIYNPYLVITIGLIVFISFISTINRALLQAKLAFGYLSIVNSIPAGIKLIVGITLVLLGYKVFGGVVAFFISFLISYCLTFFPLRFLFEKVKKTSPIKIKDLIVYGAPASLTLFGMTGFITSDVILVKHFFNPHDAGLYAGLSIFGRIIFFFSSPFSTVLFPLVVHRHALKQRYLHLMNFSILLVLTPSVLLCIFYFLFPEFLIAFVFNKKDYLDVAPLLGLFGIHMTLYSLIWLMTSFNLSIGKTKVFIPVIICSLLQAVSIWFFHGSFLQIILITLLIESLLLIILLLYYVKIYAFKKDG